MKNITAFILLFVVSISTIYAQNETIDIFDASRMGKVEILESYYNTNPKSIQQADYKGYTPLILAVYNNQSMAVKFLLSKEADVNAQDQSGNTALMGAIFKGYTPQIQQLLAVEKLDINLQNYNGATALSFAAIFGKAETIELLLKHGASKTIKDRWGKTPLDYAMIEGNEEAIKLLKAK